ncbi:probable G-protein coupled receptor 160 isoform X1 [Tupaia chinensis]|uniref:probable G-protein coupled receptor 160 isoform X1 n=1 Tax=Tupaia chinensis TaxID=246437 RepID=UPI0003C8CCDF|nr:probable G-protein coupled receptor 160 isoform X1 [Tupaia chinensis]XP_014437741.1 probable G-protein coupled receptor 160 isoform X1 [Tupaia chinensis]XP_014437742.1 probable G-protein coupled receptor 160 isoform X1 [Tupaia chinensis]XP_014437743.1 probable G-protein coupled receptor 160 isoform X1 [Tupaia chinensis]XP_014437744.1 probable G-protein coupled receptor 160 isoform X1 [Tupaia chinensis]XP_014437745.1 probable G-protein coupled receptor 160 isoform X1 [Tupaia chinensis]
MTALASENCSFRYQLHQKTQPLDVNCLLFLIVLGKIFLNILTLGLRRKNTYHSFMEYFCISLAFVDLLLLVNVSIISYLRDFVLLGVRFTQYHICLFTQITSFTYGFLHYPVFLVACIDYCLNFSTITKLSFKGRKLFYFFVVLFLWVSVLAYTLGDPSTFQSLTAQSPGSHQCTLHASTQSYWLSLSMVAILVVAFVTCWSEVVTLVQAMRITSYMNETILYFPFSSHSSYTVSSRRILLSKLLVCFLGTWLPFVPLQVVILLLQVQIPAYIEMNVPWLYFVNSFLLATGYWFNCHKLHLREMAFPVDPFVNWKCCFVPLTLHHLEQTEKPISIIIC